jgi:hypothetical protein
MGTLGCSGVIREDLGHLPAETEEGDPAAVGGRVARGPHGEIDPGGIAEGDPRHVDQ